ncbi:MAG: hypothetical protein ACHRXM_27760 [Isosphaerales bacterium]
MAARSSGVRLLLSKGTMHQATRFSRANRLLPVSGDFDCDGRTEVEAGCANDDAAPKTQQRSKQTSDFERNGAFWRRPDNSIGIMLIGIG